ncbi:hypothetical protein RHMOL_Rhmol08G0155200 [Rhododendron molle]|uniref:Uncharacterized protein n=1 Tax=Rhododendron molle TaxID=49168 RepID=A0ACC0MQ68_RHOML|nr:hypothetical protein RHMOL_Rhmol08G0155200 [Rhododendron molle]
MADHGNSGGEGGVVDRSEENRGGPMEIGQGDQTATEGAVNVSVAAMAGKASSRSVEPVGLGAVVEGSPIVEGSSVGAGGSGATGDDLGPTGSSPRDPARGKGAAVEEEETIEAPVTYREEDMLFRPAATSSSHIPITKYDVAGHLPNEMLAKLLEDNPLIGEIVLKAKEERAWAIAVAEAAERT